MIRGFLIVIFSCFCAAYVSAQFRAGIKFNTGVRTGDFADKVGKDAFKEEFGIGFRLCAEYALGDNVSVGMQVGYQRFEINATDYFPIPDIYIERFVPITATIFLHTGSTRKVDLYSGISTGYCFYELDSEGEYHNIHSFRVSPVVGLNLNFSSRISISTEFAHPIIITGRTEIIPIEPFSVDAPNWSFFEFNLGVHYRFPKDD